MFSSYLESRDAASAPAITDVIGPMGVASGPTGGVHDRGAPVPPGRARAYRDRRHAGPGRQIANDQVIEALLSAVVGGECGLDGFYVESLPSDDNGNRATSEGLFIYDRHTPTALAAGDPVRLRREVVEFHGQTELRAVGKPATCGYGLPPPVTLNCA